MTSWDVNNRSVKLYSRWTVEKYGNTNLSSTHNLTFGEMTAASAASTKFFFPYQKKYTFENGTESNEMHFYISGDNVAASPAYLAYMNAIQSGVDQNKIRVVSVGSTMQ